MSSECSTAAISAKAAMSTSAVTYDAVRHDPSISPDADRVPPAVHSADRVFRPPGPPFFPGTRHTMAAAGKLKPDPRLFPRGPSSFFAVNGLLHQCLNAGEGSGSASEITRFCHCIRPFLTP